MMRYLGAALLMAAVALPASAQTLKMSFSEGKVSLDATQVPVRTILAEWARLGGTKVVNGEKITGAPLTLKLVDMPESQALEIILRNVAGYMAAPRAAATGASLFDRILVMPTSSAPAAAASNTPSARPGTPVGPGNQRFTPPRSPSPADEDSAPPDGFDTSNSQPVFTFPQQQPGANIFQPAQQQPNNIFQPVGQPTPFGTPMMGNGQQTGAGQQGISINPTPPPNVTYPVTQPNGFGIFGSPTPGMIQQPPPQPTPGVTVIRPPGQ
jgi:hypothetical protein